MTERQIDEAIDGAVRDLMDVDADPAFRARVLSRLEHPARRVAWFRLAAVTTGAAAILAALLLTREPAPAPSIARNEPARIAAPVSPQPPSIDGGQQTPAPGPQGERGTRARSGVPPSAQGNPTHVVAPGALVATVAEAPAGGDIDALAPIEPIRMTPIAPAPIALSEIVVAPLTPITELRIAPFDPRIERD